jgi:hypothetical protein
VSTSELWGQSREIFELVFFRESVVTGLNAAVTSNSLQFSEEEK